MANRPVLTPTTITTPADKTTDTDTALAGFCLHGGHLPAAAAKWLAGLRSEHTRAAYRRDLGVFHTWMRDHLGHTDLSEVEVGDIEAFVAHQRHHGRSRTTIARRLSTLSALYRRLMVTGHVATNPAHPDLIPRGDATPDTPTRWVDGIDLQPLLALADRRGPDQTLTNPRTAIILRLLTLSGLRASEVGWLRLDDVREAKLPKMEEVKPQIAQHAFAGELVLDFDADQRRVERIPMQQHRRYGLRRERVSGRAQGDAAHA